MSEIERRRREQEEQRMMAQQQTRALPPEVQAEQRAVRSSDAEEAYRLGMKAGVLDMTGTVRPSGAPEHGMTKERLAEAEHTLMRYKAGKTHTDRRIIACQEWWRLRNWREIEKDRGTRGATERKSNTAWLWNCIVGKHADAIDSYPEPVILPRMEDDKAEAQILSEILPVVLQMNGFEETYSRAQWQKMQEGTAAYHVAWDKTKMGGMGDISITKVNLLNLYWEPGIDNIQDSENLFYVRVMSNRRLEQQYPQLTGKLKNAALKPAEYRRDENVSDEDKSVMVDWYYHTWSGERKVLQLCQFVNQEVLYCSEESSPEEGLYQDGEYPFVLDPLFPVEGSPAGMGYIDIGKDAQADIDTLNQAMVINAVVTSTPRHFIRDDGAVNEDEFADWSKPFVHVNGNLGEDSIRNIQVNAIPGNSLNMLQQKIDELKFVTGNTDINNGGVPSGVTAASAIAALKEDSGRSSKDSTRAAYRAFNLIVTMVIERIRQFYDIPRTFRILGENGNERFVTYSNEQLKVQQLEGGLGMTPGQRKPVFDVEVRSQRENAYTKMSQNELALQMLGVGVFNPQMTDQSLMLLDMMEFKGKDELMQKVERMGTMQETLMQVGQIALALAQKYEPQVAEQLAQTLMGVTQDINAAAARTSAPAKMRGNSGQIGKTDSASDKVQAGGKPWNVEAAEERAQNASRPN